MSQAHDPAAEKPHRRNPRYDFRARSHESAHANGDAAPSPKIPDHPLIPKGPAALVATAEELSELVGHLRQVGRFAYDSEFIGELSYFPKLCLIQVATAQRIALIDALAGLDLTPFWQLVADSGVEKIVHAGQQDLEPVYRLLGQSPANIFDTQIAAGFMGLAYPVGLSKLVRELTGVSLGKGFTFTHWDQRPLTNVQLRYAADDVRYLPVVRAAIGQKLDELGHSAWAAEESEALCDPSLYRPNPESDFLRVRGVGSLTPRNAAVLRELVIWRADAARRHDLPPRSYVKDEILIDMARNIPMETASLSRVRGLPRPVEAAEATNIIEAVQKALAMPEAQWPVIPVSEESPAERFSGDALWAAVQAWCHGNRIDPNLATSRQEVSRFYRQVRKNGDGSAPSASRLKRGWRAELLGNLLQSFLRGEASLKIGWQNGAIRAERA